LSEGSLSPIIVKYEKLLEDDPRSRSFAPLAEAYRQVGLIDKAFDVLKKGLRYNPDYLLGYLTLALCYFDKKEYGLAYTTLKPLISQNRDNLKLQKVFAECAKKTNNLEEALDSYKYLLFLNPKDRDIANQVSLLEEELHEEAVYSRQEATTFNVDQLEVNPADDKEIDNWVQVDLANKQLESEDEEVDDWSVGKPEEGHELQFDREGDIGNQDEIIYDQEHEYSQELSEIAPLEQNGDDNLIAFERKPIEELEKEITPVITHTLVDIYLKQGHYQKAKEILEQILEVGPKSEDALKKMSEIEALLQNSNETQEPSEGNQDEGRDDLMAAFDKSFGKADEEVDAAPSSDDNSFEDALDDLDLILSDYLTEIKQKQQSFRD